MRNPLSARVLGKVSCLFLMAAIAFSAGGATGAAHGNPPGSSIASWYGEQHRGKLMANGKPFDPDKLTAASWFYPLGTKVRVTLVSGTPRSIVVTITDRGPARRLVAKGRIIDLGHAAFKRLGPPDVGLLPVKVQVISRKAKSERDHVDLAKKAHQQDAPKLHTVNSM